MDGFFVGRNHSVVPEGCHLQKEFLVRKLPSFFMHHGFCDYVFILKEIIRITVELIGQLLFYQLINLFSVWGLHHLFLPFTTSFRSE